jgi:hypothetical protein
MDAILERQLDKAWKSTCRVLFGRELEGALLEYGPYLSKYIPKKTKRKSHLSGKEVTLASDSYPKNARFVSAEEAMQNRKYSLQINDIKDIDSLLAALSEKYEYSGNRHLGNTAYAESSDIVADSQYVYDSSKIERCANISNSNMIRDGSKYAFGCQWFAKSEFMVQVHGAHTVKRAFEAYYVTSSSDAYFCYSCVGCHDLLFSLGQRNASYRIGNLQMQKGEYAILKKKLLAEVADGLERKKSFPSLLSIVPDAAPGSVPKISPVLPKGAHDLSPIRKSFASTYNVIFKRQPKHALESYKEWLLIGGASVERYKTVFGSYTYCPTNHCHLGFLPRKRLSTVPEMLELGKIPMPKEASETLGSMIKWAETSFFLTGEFYDGNNQNVNETPCAYNAVNALGGFDVTNTDNAAYCAIALDSKHIHGGSWVLESEFSIRCFDSTYLARCLEMDFCTKCSDSYFCHNCEGLSDCMFCFNMKGARYCIGNTQLGKEDYLAARNALLGRMADELDRTCSLRTSIHNIGASHGKK